MKVGTDDSTMTHNRYHHFAGNSGFLWKLISIKGIVDNYFVQPGRDKLWLIIMLINYFMNIMVLK